MSIHRENTNQISILRLNDEKKLTDLYCKFKRVYWGFKKLARIWKIQRTPIRIQTDLYMNELDPSHKHTYRLVHENGIYLFSLQNLARIIVDAITHQSGMFVEPLTIKNPYTNDLLSKCDLINIYLSFRHNHLRVNEMFEKFFRCEFNIFEFHRKHETELRDIAIEQYAKTAADVDLAQDIDDMLRIHKLTKKMNIVPGFPRKELVSAMRPFLKIYLLERYSFYSMTRKYSAKKLDFELKRFIEKNPLFGRRIATVATETNNPFCLTPNKICKTEMKYITETTRYPRYSISNYMNTHIYDEDVFYRYVETGDSDETYNDTDPDPIDIDDYEDPPQTQSHDDEDDEEEERVGIIGTQTRTVISAYAFSSPQQPIVNQVATEIQSQLETTRTPQQIRETTLSILNRLGRIRSSLEREEQTFLTNNSEENDDYDTENEEDEVINNQESDIDEDNDSAEYMEEDEDYDSVS